MLLAILEPVCAAFYSKLYSMIHTDNTVKFSGMPLSCTIVIKGKNNQIKIDSRSRGLKINIQGDNNVITIQKGFIHNITLSLMGSGHSCHIGLNRIVQNTYITQIDSGTIVDIGDGSGIGGMKCVVKGPGNKVIIGSRCMLAENIQIWASDTHPIYDAATKQKINPDGSVIIGCDVWVGTGAMILKNTIIEPGSVIGAASVVTKKIPANSIAAGNPCRLIRQGITWSIIE